MFKSARKMMFSFYVFLVLFVLSFFAHAPAVAQELVLKDALAFGGGSVFGEEGETFDTSALFGSVQWRGLKLPLNSSTGIGLEISSKPDELGESKLTLTVWSLSRADIVGGIYAGTDLKIMENTRSNFDLRVVAGTLLGKIKGGELALEIYSLEEDRPISFALFYRR